MGVELIVLLLATWIAKHWQDSPARGSGRARQPPKRQIPPARRLPPTQKPVTPAPVAKPTLPQPSPVQATRNAAQPPPWPQAMPSGLPPWPAGWQPAQPPPAAVVTRAWQLLPTLWAKGVGNRTTEKTGNDWITYVATWMNAAKTTKGVVAYKPKPGAPRPAPRQPSGNA
jgi:hypothetical protein